MAMGTWETVGQITGTWLGAVIWAASAPVVVLDGPLPIADAAWMYANARNTNNLRKKGGMIGSSLDNVLADSSSSPGSSWGDSSLAPKTLSNEKIEFDFSGYGTGFTMGSFLEFGLDFTGVPKYIPIVQEIQEVAQEIKSSAMGLSYTYRNSEWPEWND
jgi:hypothetical protein